MSFCESKIRPRTSYGGSSLTVAGGWIHVGSRLLQVSRVQFLCIYFHSFCDRDAILGFCAYDVRVFTIHQRSIFGARVFSLAIGTFCEVLFLSCRSSALSRWVNMPPLPKLLQLTLKCHPVVTSFHPDGCRGVGSQRTAFDCQHCLWSPPRRNHRAVRATFQASIG